MSCSASEFLKWCLVFKVARGPVSGSITINTGAGLAGGGTVPLGGTLNLSADTSWVEVTGTTQAMQSNKSYGIENAALTTLTLPVTAALGDVIKVFGKGAGGWKIAQNASQKIILGEAETTVGAAGSIESTYQDDIVILTCITANTTWSAYCPSGNLTVI